MSEDYLFKSAYVAEFGDSKDCVFEAVPIKQTSDGVSMSEELKPLFEVKSRIIFSHNEYDKAVVLEVFVNKYKHSTHTEGLTEHTNLNYWIKKQMEFAYDMGRAAKPTFTKEDVEKAWNGFLLKHEHIHASNEKLEYSDMLNKCLKSALNAVGRVEE